MLRRNSQLTDKEDKGMNIINMDDQSSNDTGFDPPTKIDSGRGSNTNSFVVNGFMGRTGDQIP